jgi:hypothetical protein
MTIVRISLTDTGSKFSDTSSSLYFTRMEMRNILECILLSLGAFWGFTSAALVPHNAVEVVEDTSAITAHHPDALPVYTPYLDGNSILPENSKRIWERRSDLAKRSFYTCFNRAVRALQFRHTPPYSSSPS